MGDAYGFALGIAPKPPILQLLHEIEHYGAASVMGRTLYAGEIYQMNACGNIVDWFRAREQHPNGYAAWAKEHHEQAGLLAIAEKDWITRHPDE